MSLSAIVETDSEPERRPHPQDEYAASSVSDSETLNETSHPNVNNTQHFEQQRYKPEEQKEDGGFPDGMRDVTDSDRNQLRLHKIKATGPGKRFNPTNARFHIHWKSNRDDSSESQPFRDPDTGDEVALRWSSRYNRKGRNSFVVSRSNSTIPRRPGRFHQAISNAIRISKNILRMFISFPYWDMAFWSGWAYTWGSVIFVIDGAFSWVPLAFPDTKFQGEDYSVGLLFFFGALLYEVGATIAYLEAINDGSFHGSAMRRFLEGHEDDQKKLLDEKIATFFGHIVPHTSKKSKVKKSVTRPEDISDLQAGRNPEAPEEKPEFPHSRRGGIDFGTAEQGTVVEHLPWRWWPTWSNLKSHHIREIGWWACAIQLFGATLYGMTGIVALPGILDSLEQWQENAAYWIPQMIALCSFLTASVLFTLETQEKWYRLEPNVLGWWIGIWAGVGSIGFLLCACLGPAYGSPGAQYQGGLSSTWGSAAYLISGLLQWYEAVNKHPIEELLNEPGEMKSFQIHPV